MEKHPLAIGVTSIRQMVLLVIAATVCALVQGWIVGKPDLDGSSDVWAISVESALARESVLWVDARGEAAFAVAHREGAVRLDLDDWDGGLIQVLARWDPESTVIVYCDGHGCESSKAIAEKLRADLGSESVYWLAGGWPALQQAEVRP